MKDVSTGQLLTTAETAMRDARVMAREFPKAHQETIEALLEVIRRQQAQIAALTARLDADVQEDR